MQAHTGFILLRNCYPFLSSTFASEFPSVALLVFPLFSFQCAVVDASSAYSVSASSLAASRENFILLRCISSSNRSLRFDLIWDEGFLRFLELQTNEVFEVRRRQIARPDEEAPLRGASSP